VAQAAIGRLFANPTSNPPPRHFVKATKTRRTCPSSSIAAARSRSGARSILALPQLPSGENSVLHCAVIDLTEMYGEERAIDG